MPTQLRADTGPYAIIPEWVVRTVGCSALRIYWELARMANTGGSCWPSISKISTLCDMNNKTVRAGLDELVEAGAVSVQERHHEGGGQTSNMYLVHTVPPSQKLVPPPPKKREGPPTENWEGPPTEKRYPRKEEKTKENTNQGDVDLAVSILDFLNDKAGRKFPAKGMQFDHITARLKAGHSPEDLKLIIEHACAKWLGDNKMEEFIRPQTLFGPEKILEYLPQAKKWAEKGKPALVSGETARRAQMLQQDQQGKPVVSSTEQDHLDTMRREFFLKHNRPMTKVELAEARQEARRLAGDSNGTDL